MRDAATSAHEIRVLLAEDQTTVHAGLAAVLEMEPDIHVIAQAMNGREAQRLTRELRPDVVIAGMEMPERSGVELAVGLKESGSKSRIIIISASLRGEDLQRALDAGANGYLLKDRPANVVADAIRRVCNGERVIDPKLDVGTGSTEVDPLKQGERGL